MNRHPNELTGSPIGDEQEISLFEIYAILARRRSWVVSIALVFVVAALSYVFMVSPEWEATAAIQVGQIGGTGVVDRVVERIAGLVEPPARAVERMKRGTFENAVLSNLGVPLSDNDPEAALFRKSFKLKSLPNTDLIQIDLRAHSIDEAKRRMAAVVETLSKIHGQIAEPSISRLKSLSAQVAGDMERVRKEREKVLKTLETNSKLGAADSFAQNVLLASVLQTQDSELRILEERKLALDENLSTAKTYPTSVIDATYVSDQPVFPKKTLIVLLSGVIGLILGILAAFVVEGLDHRQRSLGVSQR